MTNFKFYVEHFAILQLVNFSSYISLFIKRRRLSRTRTSYTRNQSAVRIQERVIDYTCNGERQTRREKKAKTETRGRGWGRMQAKQPRISNGCEYIAVINFAKKKPKEGWVKSLLGRPVSRRCSLRVRFLREQGATAKKSQRKAVERAYDEAVTFPVRASDGHVFPHSTNRLAAVCGRAETTLWPAELHPSRIRPTDQ